MGIEGHESPRDVASEEKKHPWEIFPEDDSSLKNEKNKDEKKRKKSNKLVLWLKTHVIISVVAVIVVIAIVFSCVVVITKINEGNKKKESEVGYQGENDNIVYPEDYTVKDSVRVEDAFSYANSYVRKIALQGIDQKKIDYTKLEDNLDVFIDNLGSDYEKVYFKLYKIFLLASRDNTARAEVLLEEFDKKNYKLDKKQRYMYYRAYEAYYFMIGDKENQKKYRKLIHEDPEFFEDSFTSIDEKTGEVIKDKELINRQWEIYKKELQEGLYE